MNTKNVIGMPMIELRTEPETVRRGWTAGANKLNSISTRRAHTADMDGSDRFRGILRVAGGKYPGTRGGVLGPVAV